MKMRTILEASKYDVSRSQMQQWFMECIRKYFSEYKSKVGTIWEMPTFVIKSDAKRAGWFKYRFAGNALTDQEIGVNKDFLLGETFRNIVYHETIHYIQGNTYGRAKFEHVQSGGHDAFFKESMNRINATEGKDFITVKQDTAGLDSTSNGKMFWVYGILTHRGEYGFAHTGKENQSAIDFLKKLITSNQYKNAFLFQSNKFKYKIGSFGKRGFSFGVPNDQSSFADELEQYALKK